MARRSRRGFFMRARRTVTRVVRRRTRSRPVARVARRSRALMGKVPAWAKPSNFTAGVGVGAGTLQLVGTPLPDGDSWINRTIDGIDGVRAGYSLHDSFIGTDGANPVSVAAQQVKQNAVPSIITVTGFSLASALLKHFGL